MKRALALSLAGASAGLLVPMMIIGGPARAACPASSWQPNPPPGFNTAARNITDGQTTAGSNTYVSTSQAKFDQYDAGRTITGTNIPDNTTIASVQSLTSVTLSNAATASGSGLSATIAAQQWQNPSNEVAGTPDGSTVVYDANGSSTSSVPWIGVSSTTASGAGLSGYAELNETSTPAFPVGYLAAAGTSPAGGGGIAIGSGGGGPADLGGQC